MENKRIAFVINTMGAGGAERVISVLANEMCKTNVIVIITLFDNIISYKISKKVKIYFLKDQQESKFKIQKLVKRFNKYMHLMKKINPDYVISFLPEASLLSSIAYILDGKKKYKYIISERNDPSNEYNKGIIKIIYKYLFKQADGFVFQTTDALKFYQASKIINQQKKYKIIFNPVDDKFLLKSHNFNTEKLEIVSVGRLNTQKNFPLLIDAFSEIKKKYPKIILKIYGEGQERENLEKLIKKYNLNSSVELMGISKNICDDIINAKLFILPSNFEGMPNALIEAMSIGLPCISTDCSCGGPKELIKNNYNGILIEVNNKAELIESIDKCLSSDDFRKKIGNNAKKIRQVVNKKNICKQWIDLIQSLN